MKLFFLLIELFDYMDTLVLEPITNIVSHMC